MVETSQAKCNQCSKPVSLERRIISLELMTTSKSVLTYDIIKRYQDNYALLGSIRDELGLGDSVNIHAVASTL